MRNAVMICLALALLAPGDAGAQPSAPAPPQDSDAKGRVFEAVNGQQIRCPAPLSQDTALREMTELLLTPGSGFDLPAMLKRNPGGFENFLKMQAEQRAKDWPYLCRYRDANAAFREAGHRADVVFMGDSITENWMIANAGFFARGYVDRGISGQTSNQMLVRFYPDVIALKPRVVHIMTGTNDVGGNNGPVTEDEVIGNISAMIDIAKAHDVKVVLASIPPLAKLPMNADFKPAANVRSLNARLRALAAERKVTFLNYYPALTGAEGGLRADLTNDGVHPTRKGYAIMEPLALKAIAEAGRTSR